MTEADLLENYKKAYDNRVGYGKRPWLLMVDSVQAYFEPGNALYAGVDDALASALRVRAAARAKNIPVILTGMLLHRSGKDGGRFFQKAKPLENFTAGNPMAA